MCMDNKNSHFSKKHHFFSSLDLGNTNNLLNKKELTKDANKYVKNNDNIEHNISDNKNNSLIKVKIKMSKEKSPKRNDIYNDINSKTRIDLSNANKNKLLNMKLNQNLKEKDGNNFKKMQKKFFINEKLKFFIKKIKNLFLSKIFGLIKIKYKCENKIYKSHSFLKNFKSKKNYKLNLSSKEKSKPKKKEKRYNNITNSNNYNIFNKSHKYKIPSGKLRNIGLKRPPSQIFKKDLEHNINLANHSNIEQKQRSVKTKTKKYSILNNSKSKKNKSLNKKNNNRSLDNINIKYNFKLNNYNIHNKLNMKNYPNLKKEIKNNDIKLKDNNHFIINSKEEELNKSLNDNNIIDKNINRNEVIQYYNTEKISNPINNPPHIYKVYENALFEGNIFFDSNFENPQNNKKVTKTRIYPSSPERNNINNINCLFLKKNISSKKASPNNTNKKNEKCNLNIKVNNFNNVYKIDQKHLYFPRYETSPINKNLFNLFNINIKIKNVFDFWKYFAEKKIIIYRFLKRIKIFKIIKKSQSIILKKIIRLLNNCILSNYFKKYKDIYYKKKIINNIINFKNKTIKCINIPLIENNGHDIINNININNYINYADYNKLMKKRAQSQINISKLGIFEKESKNNYNYKEMKYNGNIFNENNNYRNNINYSYNLHNYYEDNYTSYSRTDRLYYDNNLNLDNNLIQTIKEKNIMDINNLNINRQNIILNRNNTNNYNYNYNYNYINNNIFNNNEQSDIIPKKITIVDQVNQLRMVFNLLDQHKKNKKNILHEYFEKWLYEAKINTTLNSKSLFWSFSGGDIIHNIKDENSNLDKYSLSTYKEEKSLNNNSPKKSKLEIGKYTPVRGIKNFICKTNQKVDNNQRQFNYNYDENNDINKEMNYNYNIFINNYQSLMNNNNINKNDTNIIYHKKKLCTPNNLCHNNCFLENNNNNNNSYLMNIGDYKPMNITNYNFYKNETIKNKNNYSNINLRNNEINSFYNDINNNGFLYISPYKSCTQIKSNIIQEKQVNRIEEKEINFALSKEIILIIKNQK